LGEGLGDVARFPQGGLALVAHQVNYLFEQLGMNQEQFWQQWLEMQQQQTTALERIAASLERLAPVNQQAPNYQKPLEEFRSFDWATIGATVLQSDPSGVAIVEWNGQQFTRRSPTNKFGEAIWFSRSVGKDDEGNVRYERLITFRKFGEVEPIPERVNRAISHS
jgi:hypothetical protein